MPERPSPPNLFRGPPFAYSLSHQGVFPFFAVLAIPISSGLLCPAFQPQMMDLVASKFRSMANESKDAYRPENDRFSVERTHVSVSSRKWKKIIRFAGNNDTGVRYNFKPPHSALITIAGFVRRFRPIRRISNNIFPLT